VRATTFLAILCFVLGILAATFFHDEYVARTRLPDWLVVIILVVDISLVLYAPVQAREYYIAWKLAGTGPEWQKTYKTSRMELLVLIAVFIVFPVAVFVWLLSLW
jgi:hypothetical protein